MLYALAPIVFDLPALNFQTLMRRVTLSLGKHPGRTGKYWKISELLENEWVVLVASHQSSVVINMRSLWNSEGTSKALKSI